MLFTLFSVLVGLSSCTDNFMKQNISNESGKSGVNRTIIRPDGTVSQTASANYVGTQTLTAPASSALSGTEVVFPSGSLAISALVSLAAGTTVASDSLATGLGINTSFTNSGVPVVIGSTPSQDTKSPFALSIPLPNSASLADGETTAQNVVVIFERYNATDKSYTSGVLAGDQLEIVGTSVRFTTVNFGTFQSAYTKDKVTASVSKAGKVAEIAATPTPTPTPEIKAAITISGISAGVANGTYYFGDDVSIKVKLSSSVKVTGATSGLTLSLNCGLAPASYQSGSGTDTLTFSYHVNDEDFCARLDQTGTVLTLGDAVLTSDTENAALVTLPVTGAAASLAVQSAIAIDGKSPTVAFNTLAQPTAAATGTMQVTVSKNFSSLTFYGDSACTLLISAPISGTGATTSTVSLLGQNPGSQIPAFVKASDTTGTYTSPCKALNQIVTTPNPVKTMTATGHPGERHTFSDGVRQWAFWRTPTGIAHGYSEDNGLTFVSTSAHAIHGYADSQFAVTYKNGVAILVYTQPSGGMIAGVRGVLTTNARSWTWGSSVSLLSGSYSKPTVTIGGDGWVYVGGVYSPSGAESYVKAVRASDYQATLSGGTTISVTATNRGLDIDAMVLVGTANTSTPARAFVSYGGAVKQFVYNGSGWSQVNGDVGDWAKVAGPGGLDGSIYASLIYRGDLVVGGAFGLSATDAGVSMRGVARWNGSSWIGLGSSLPLNSTVKALAVGPSGSLVIGGGGGATVFPFVKTFDDASAAWSDIGSAGFTGSYISAIAFDTAGNMFVGGAFGSSSISGMNNVGKYNGSAWGNMGGASNTVTTIESLLVANAKLYVGGTFTQLQGLAAAHIAQYDIATSTWSNIGVPCGGIPVARLLIGYQKMVYAACSGNTGIRIYNGGSSWGTFGAGTLTGSLFAVTFDPSSDTFYAGLSTTVSVCKVASGTCTWSDMAGGVVGGNILTVAVGAQGRLYVGGTFNQTPNSIKVGRIYQYDAVANLMSPVGDGFLNGFNSTLINAVASDGAGSIYVGGHFTSINGVIAKNIAKWSPLSGWSALTSSGFGTSASDIVRAIAIRDNSTIYVGGDFSSFDLSSCALPSCATLTSFGNLNYPVSAIAVGPAANDVVVATPTAANKLMSYNGTTFVSFGSWSSGSVNALVYASGAIYAAGMDTGPVMRSCNNASCTDVGTLAGGEVFALASNGSIVYAGGSFTSMNSVAGTSRIAMFNGVSWTALGGGISGTKVSSIAYDSVGTGKLYVAGNFSGAGGVNVTNLATLSLSTGTWSSMGSTPMDIGSIVWSAGADYPVAGIGSSGVFAFNNTLVAPRVSSFSVAAAGDSVLLAYGDGKTRAPFERQYVGGVWSSAASIGSAPVTGRIWASTSSDLSQRAYIWESYGSLSTSSTRTSAQTLTQPLTYFPNLAELIVDAQTFVSMIFSEPLANDGAIITGIAVP